MKILIYGINFFPELVGIGKYTGEASDWLSKKGHEVRVITAPPYYPEWRTGTGYSSWKYKTELNGSIHVFRCPVWIPSKPNGVKRILHLISFAISSLPVLIKNVFWRPDIIITIEPPFFISPGTLLLSKIWGAKTCLHVQDLEIDAAFDLGIVPSCFRGWIEKAEKFILMKFDCVSTISGKMKEKLLEKGVPPEKTLLFPNWVDTRKICPIDVNSSLKMELRIPPEAVVALYSGNMGEKQGLEIVIEAARQLQNEKNLAFVMCGSGATYLKLKKAATGLSNIYWIPLQPVERLNDLLNLADIHLLPQRADVADLVMPSKLTGMMASGRPVLGTAVEGTQIAMALQKGGKVVPPGDLKAFVSALKELAKDVCLRQKLGIEARRYATENFDKESVLSRFENDLEGLLHGVAHRSNRFIEL